MGVSSPSSPDPELPARIAVIGLGYVGLPLAVALARGLAGRSRLLGYDHDRTRIAELRAGKDRCQSLDASQLKTLPQTLDLSHDSEDLADQQAFIITLPTPVGDDHQPDLSQLLACCRQIATLLKSGDLVVIESSVAPGTCEDVCLPLLEAGSHLRAGRDFFFGTAPERINPGDDEHSVTKVTKVIAGFSPACRDRLAKLYAHLGAPLHHAPSIRVAEAAKMVENAQRAVNIAFVNEIALMAHDQGLSAYDVLETARSKWNFLDFRPGLVGGHCIAVDPHYLLAAAQKEGRDLPLLRQTQKANADMYIATADLLCAHLAAPTAGPLLFCGLTYKENVPDLRNSQNLHLARLLMARGFELVLLDPLADAQSVERSLGCPLTPEAQALTLRVLSPKAQAYQAVIVAVAHRLFRESLTPEKLRPLLATKALVADLKGYWPRASEKEDWPHQRLWRL